MRALVVSFLAFAATGENPPNEELWKHFKDKHGKNYGSEEQHRFQIFKDNLDRINRHNAQKLSYKMKINKFGDLTNEEFGRMRLRGLRFDTKGVFATVPFPNFPKDKAADAIDWVEQGAVTSVKDQGMCGSCWAFSAVGAIEGAYVVAGGQLTELSVGEIVQCENYGDQGCEGGLMDNAYQWVIQNGITTAAAYPYTSASGLTGTCTGNAAPAVTITGFTFVPTGDESSLKSAVSEQPVSVAIEASSMEFQLYGGGVFDSPACGHALDHGVVIVGYGTDGQDYWKVKNTWAADWGEDGYIRVARGKNMCGIADYAVYPVGAKDADQHQMRRDL